MGRSVFPPLARWAAAARWVAAASGMSRNSRQGIGYSRRGTADGGVEVGQPFRADGVAVVAGELLDMGDCPHPRKFTRFFYEAKFIL